MTDVRFVWRATMTYKENQSKLNRVTSARRPITELVGDIQRLTEEIQALYCSDAVPWVVGYSGGKDSSAVLQLVWNAISHLAPEKRIKRIHVISTDTLVENPVVSAWVRHSLERIQESAQQQGLPITPHLLHPEIKDTFWVNLIGRGYPAPRNKFRWCTERLKIQPANRFIREMVRMNGETILVLGTRKAESVKRAATMAKHAEGRVRERLSPNASLPNSLIYSPIEDWTDDEVWTYLMQVSNPWGHSNKELLAMYKGATADNDCPLVVDTSTPSCGNSRFGCWVCTMVTQDKSMAAMIQNDEEKAWMEPLLKIRNELDVQDDKDRRDFRRMNGSVQLFERKAEDGTLEVVPIPGPYRKEWREYWLRLVLETQTYIRQTGPEHVRDLELITMAELREIRRIWLYEKYEFEDSLPRIYQQATGLEFPGVDFGSNSQILGSDEWEVLLEVCGDDAMHMELMAKLLGTEQKYRMMARRAGIYGALESCFKSSSLTQTQAVDQAKQLYNLKNAINQGDIMEVKKQLFPEETSHSASQQLSWANLKYGIGSFNPEFELEDKYN